MPADFDVWTFDVVDVEEHPAVNPNAANADVNKDNFKENSRSRLPQHCGRFKHKSSEQHLVNYFIIAILVELNALTRQILNANCIQMLQEIKKDEFCNVQTPNLALQ